MVRVRRRVADQEGDLLRAAESLVGTERRLDRSRVLGPRAERTKRKLVDASSELFRTVGYANTTVADIAKQAGVSLPTFYQYFADLNDVIAVIVVDFIKESVQRGLDRWDVVGTGPAGLARWIEAFLRTYVDYADFMELWECAKLMSPRIRALSRDYARFYVRTFESAIQEGIDASMIRDDLTAGEMAEVLVTSVEYFAYERYVLSREVPAGLDGPVATLTAMLASGLHLSAAAAPGHR